MGCLQVGLPHARKPSGWFFVVRRIREKMTKILWKATENSSAWGFSGWTSDQAMVGESWRGREAGMMSTRKAVSTSRFRA